MNVLVTGGGTIAPIDDVRAITNLSTGRFAASISESWLNRGADVWHLHAPNAFLPLKRHAVFDLDATDPAAEMLRLERLRERWNEVRSRLKLVPLRMGTVSNYSEALRSLLSSRPFDVVFLAMAASDYEPEPLAGKLGSTKSDLIVHCRPTPKVIRSVRDWAPSVYLVGFKLLSRVSVAYLIRQAEISGFENRADLTVANDLQTLTAGRHTVHLVRPGHVPETLDPGHELADRLVERVARWALEKRSTDAAQ